MSHLDAFQMVVQELSAFSQVLHNMLATTTCIIWYTILTLDEEVEFIWPSKSSPVKILYMVVRYLPRVFQAGVVFVFFINVNIKGIGALCSGIIWFVGIVAIVIAACSNILFIQRVYAFYGCSKRVLWFLLTIFILNETAVFVLVVIGASKYHIVPDSILQPFPESFGSCIIQKKDRIIAFVWFLGLLFQTIAFTCIAAKCLHLQYISWKSGISHSQLYKVLFRDGAWTFCILFFCFLFAGIYMYTRITIGLSILLWAITACSICSTHIVLNLHQSAKKGGYSGDSSLYISRR